MGLRAKPLVELLVGGDPGRGGLPTRGRGSHFLLAFSGPGLGGGAASPARACSVASWIQDRAMHHGSRPVASQTPELRGTVLLAGTAVDSLFSPAVSRRLESLLETLQQDSRALRCQLVELQSNGNNSGCCPKGWSAHDKSCYWLSHSRWPWAEAKRDCERKDSHLVIINSPKEKEFVDHFRRSTSIWIGLTDSSGSWMWVDGTRYTVNPEDWDVGQPDHWYGHGLGGGEDCVHTLPNGLWNDNHCSRIFGWMCEVELQD